jgi:hypothetical protein
MGNIYCQAKTKQPSGLDGDDDLATLTTGAGRGGSAEFAAACIWWTDQTVLLHWFFAASSSAGHGQPIHQDF